MPKSPFNIRIIFRFMGFLLFIESLFMLLAAGVAGIYHESELYIFLQSAAITLVCSVILILLGWKASSLVGKHESFVIVTMVWILFSLFGSIPYIISPYFQTFTDAYFESISGFSSAGATILADIEALPYSLLFWRSLSQWLGGMGIILLSLAIFPVMKLGSFQLFTAEVTGPVYEKLRPRLSETAKIMWIVYCVLTLLETLLLWAGDMNFFDAICHAFTTMATGGFSTKNASIGHWNSTYIDMVVTFFMFLAGTSVFVLFRAVSRDFDKIKRNEEFKWYVIVVLISGLVLSLLLIFVNQIEVGEALTDGFFQAIAIITTSGYSTTDIGNWSHVAQFVILILMCTGAMSGSTSGGIKIGRHIIFFKSAYNELQRDVHPNAILPVMYNGKALPSATISNLFGFLVFYILLVALSVGIFYTMGLNMEESLSVSLSSLGNVGPALGSFTSHYALMPAFGKWWMCFLMLVGRLEIYTILLLLSRSFWNKA